MDKIKQRQLSTEEIDKNNKPRYRFTAQCLRISFACAWLVILSIVFGGLLGSEKADKLADIIVPSMVALIVSLLGVHRAFGSLDYRARYNQNQYDDIK